MSISSVVVNQANLSKVSPTFILGVKVSKVNVGAVVSNLNFAFAFCILSTKSSTSVWVVADKFFHWLIRLS